MEQGAFLQSRKKIILLYGGTGFQVWKWKNNKKPKKILSVRGPLTRKRLLELDYECPETYGDSGMILPYFYYPEIKKKYKLGIIPHYIDGENI